MIETATQAAAEPQDFYDTLGETGQALWDQIGIRGYKPEKTDEGFIATKISDPSEVIGPLPYLGSLSMAVREAVGDPLTDDEPEFVGEAFEGEVVEDEETDTLVAEGPVTDPPVIELTEDHRGNTFLPGAGPIVDEQLAKAAGDYFARNSEWKDAGEKRKAAKDNLSTIAEMKKDLFKPDPDNSNSLIYHAGGMLIRIARETKQNVTVEIEDEG